MSITMKIFTIISVQVIILACLFLEASHAQETEERQCLEDNNLTPADEPDDGIFNDFASQLKTYTGLGTSPHPVDLSCGSCLVNPNGTAIWDARMYLYSNNMMPNADNNKTTLDGCLCYSTDTVDYINCMTEVRTIMIDQLDTILIPKFKEIMESDCSTLVELNCIA